MEIYFSNLKEKEVINVCDGKRLGKIFDIVFSGETGAVLGVVVPGERRLFKKGDNIFIPLKDIKRIGDDVILSDLKVNKRFEAQYRNNNFSANNSYLNNFDYDRYFVKNNINNSQSQSNKDNVSYIRYKKMKIR